MLLLRQQRSTLKVALRIVHRREAVVAGAIIETEQVTAGRCECVYNNSYVMMKRARVS
jgi:hypothetical protein